MGLGGAPSEWDEYEWVRLADLPPAPASGPGGRQRALALAAGRLGGYCQPGAAPTLLGETGLWTDAPGVRVLLVDLDNLRASPVRWRRRMAMVVSLARQADHVVLAGQQGAVRRGRPYLAEFAPRAQPVADGGDLADHVLLDAAEAVSGPAVQFVVVSNDGIFATLAGRGVLTVLSPGADALSDRLRAAATQVIDLVALETAGGADRAGPGRAVAGPAQPIGAVRTAVGPP